MDSTRRCQCFAGFHQAGLTSANAAPYLITVSQALSVDPLISGEYFSNRPSSSWSDERRDFAYTVVIKPVGVRSGKETHGGAWGEL